MEGLSGVRQQMITQRSPTILAAFVERNGLILILTHNATVLWGKRKFDLAVALKRTGTEVLDESTTKKSLNRRKTEVTVALPGLYIITASSQPPRIRPRSHCGGLG